MSRLDGVTSDGLPVAPSMEPALAAAHVPPRSTLVDARVVFICALAMAVALAAGGVAQLLTRLIGLVTNLSFYGRLSTAFVSPAGHHLGAAVIVVPVVGGLLVGLMARYGSRAIRGHGIPEAMEQVLTNQSRIPARMTFLKPLSAALAIGTGGPFGAEGPIIATGGALGSLLGQWVHVSAQERKTLLAAGAAAGMAATFGSPVSAVLLAVELLLFEYRPRSLIPVSFAASVATAVRYAFVGSAAVFPMSDLSQPSGGALATYIGIGALIGVAAVLVTRAVYAVEDGFEKLPIHWMWWPALGGVAVGLVGYVAPRTMGVGYDNIEAIVAGHLTGSALAILCTFKLVSWCIALGSGTSGGTLAPLFTVGGGLGALLGSAAAALLPSVGIDARVAALVGMAAIFAGASRALLASVVFAFETTRQPLGLLPLLGGCAAAYLISCLAMRHSIMTEKIARRGLHVAGEYVADFLSSRPVRDHMSAAVVTLPADQRLDEARQFIASHGTGARHQGFPVLDPHGRLVGVLTRRDLTDPDRDGAEPLRALVKKPPIVLFDDGTLRDAVDQMARAAVGRLPVLSRADGRLCGIVSRSDVLVAEARRLAEHH
ncbi:MAG: Chloride channel protein [Myxococcales bacterium]|nr:Chloride channel protein [Myxococcales bacterium]